MDRKLLKSFAFYLHEAIWNVWFASLAAIITVYEVLRGFIQSPTLPPVPSAAYWTLGIVLLLIAPFRAFQQQKNRADIYEVMCRQIFEENFVFLNYGKESRRAPRAIIDKGMSLLEEIGREVDAGNFSRAGMAIPLYHELYNLFLDYYGGSTEGTIKFWNRGRQIVETVLAKGFSDCPLSAQMRGEAYETFRDRWAKQLKR